MWWGGLFVSSIAETPRSKSEPGSGSSDRVQTTLGGSRNWDPQDSGGRYAALIGVTMWHEVCLQTPEAHLTSNLRGTGGSDLRGPTGLFSGEGVGSVLDPQVGQNRLAAGLMPDGLPFGTGSPDRVQTTLVPIWAK